MSPLQTRCSGRTCDADKSAVFCEALRFRAESPIRSRPSRPRANDISQRDVVQPCRRNRGTSPARPCSRRARFLDIASTNIALNSQSNSFYLLFDWNEYLDTANPDARLRKGRSVLMNISTLHRQPDHYELRFRSLFHPGRALAFPCDDRGHFELNALSDRARLNYLYARAVVGREFAMPAVLPSDMH